MNRHRLLLTFLFTFLILSACTTKPHTPPAPSTLQPPPPLFSETQHIKTNWWKNLPRFMQEQARRTLDQSNQLLDTHRPTTTPSSVRRAALLMIDQVLHHQDAPDWPIVQQYFTDHITRVAEDLEQHHPTQGIFIYKIYNHGFIIRTPTVTFAFDLTRAKLPNHPSFGLSDQLTQRLIDQCDFLLISHFHYDHADLAVAKRFIQQNKPVLTPPQLWQDKPIHAALTHLPRSASAPHQTHTLSLTHRSKPQSITIINYPGHQGPGTDIQNNIPLVITPENIAIAHTGDQWLSADFEWIDTIHQHHPVDILIPNCWTMDLPRLVRGFNPKLIIPGHENELNHRIDQREPLWLTFDRLTHANTTNQKQTPSVIMTWGEKYHYIPEIKPTSQSN
ncbi:MBL fold metallo-hydrolase [Poriferisphaera sp. WC338]|uniref:MBL fold metallo-hydrolase n=1 Tax=Poriferisphaera sp. WC338 TaxID=3425129 RepID=UPI003D8186A5